jgi:hypothetical protein
MLMGSETGTGIKDGMLIDWDLSKAINPSSQDRPDAPPRRLGRTVSKSVSEAVWILSS